MPGAPSDCTRLRDHQLRVFVGETQIRWCFAVFATEKKAPKASQGDPSRIIRTCSRELVDGVVEREIPWDFAFDCYFTKTESPNHIQSHKRGYVRNLKSNRKVRFKGGEMQASEWAAGVAADRPQTGGHGRPQSVVLTRSVRLPQVDHPVCLVMLWDRKIPPEAGQVPGDRPGVLGGQW